MRPVLLIVSLFTVAIVTIPVLDQDIGERIFHEGEICLLYVSASPSQNVTQALQQFCVGEVNHKVMQLEVEMFHRLLDFVGMASSEYLLIIDTPKRLKYTLPLADATITVDTVGQFYHGYWEGILEPYYSSEPIPQNEHQKDKNIRFIVGQTLKQFLIEQPPIKVLLLFADEQLCETCIEVYSQVAEVAKQLTDRQRIDFGALNLFKNQHPDLHEQNVPYVLVFRDGIKIHRLHPNEVPALKTLLEKQLSLESSPPGDEL